ncbi:hypothetical protein [Kiloniella antarctica]|uniref:HPt domain-containing protein n=1 Tax=Kiloniella antarctica TaxID=1550907 RepID=A0ABW5BIG8_9PROT
MPTNNLKPKVPSRGGPELKDIVASAEEALSRMEGDYEIWVAKDVQKISDFLEGAKESLEMGAQSQSDFIEEIHVVGHNIKGQAATFNFPLLTSAAKSLCHFIQEGGATAEKRLDLVEAHVNTMKIILAQKMKGNGGKSDRGLITALEQAVEKVLTTQSKS